MTTLSRTLKRTVVTIGVASLLLAADAGRAGASCGGLPILGQICTFAFNFCPQQFLPADGRIITKASNPALFAVIGTSYGGDGQHTFALPDLRSRTVVGGVGPVGQTAGDATTVGLRLDNVSGGVAVPATQSPFTGLTRCVAVGGRLPQQP